MFSVKKFYNILVLKMFIPILWTKMLQEDFTANSCTPPQLALNGTENEDGEILVRNGYIDIREVKFSGEIGPLGEHRLCKIKCIAGQWVGPLCSDRQDNGRFQPLFRNCGLDYINPHMLLTFRNVSIQTTGWVFPHGAKLQTRCKKLGLYKLLGTATILCKNGDWSSRLPSCVPTTLLTNFTEDSPPSILIKIPSGSASIEPGGELVVFPGSTVHFECIFSRRLGSPDWTWTSPLGQYLTGWAIASEERNWKYRLSIYYAKSQDSGTFTCATPRGITNSIIMYVTAIHCDPISAIGMHINVRLEGTRLGQKAVFQCPVGFRISGETNLTCQASGKWSAPTPKCELVRCPSLDTSVSKLLDPYLQLEEYNNSYGGRSVFSCAWGYRLVGNPGIECELNGNWSGPLPECVPIQCPPPVLPVNGYLTQSEAPGMDGGRYAVGSLVQFTCLGVHHLEGEASIICTETGFWSHPPPFCKPKCASVREPVNGIIAPSRSTYDPGDAIDIICNPGFVSNLSLKPKCLPNGEWSIEIYDCKKYFTEEKLYYPSRWLKRKSAPEGPAEANELAFINSSKNEDVL